MNEQYLDFSFINYISDNFIGIFLLIVSFFIIYFVDRINQFNSTMILLSNSTPAFGIPNSFPIKTANIIKKKHRSHKIRPR
jgi:hypothetical protein